MCAVGKGGASATWGVISITLGVFAHGSITQNSRVHRNSNFLHLFLLTEQRLVGDLLAFTGLEQRVGEALGTGEARAALYPAAQDPARDHPEGITCRSRVGGLVPNLPVGLGQVGVIIIPPDLLWRFMGQAAIVRK